MRDKEFVEGLIILAKYRKEGYVIQSTTDDINVGSTEIPVDIEDFQRLIYLGFSFESIGIPDEPCKTEGGATRIVYCYGIYVRNIKGQWHYA